MLPFAIFYRLKRNTVDLYCQLCSSMTLEHRTLLLKYWIFEE